MYIEDEDPDLRRVVDAESLISAQSLSRLRRILKRSGRQWKRIAIGDYIIERVSELCSLLPCNMSQADVVLV